MVSSGAQIHCLCCYDVAGMSSRALLRNSSAKVASRPCPNCPYMFQTGKTSSGHPKSMGSLVDRMMEGSPRGDHPMAVLGVVHGCNHKHLRERCSLQRGMTN
jgi:hypothetical protein